MKKVLHEHTPLLKMLHKKTNQSSHKKINKVNSYRKNQHRDSKSEITLGQIGTKQKAESWQYPSVKRHWKWSSKMPVVFFTFPGRPFFTTQIPHTHGNFFSKFSYCQVFSRSSCFSFGRNLRVVSEFFFFLMHPFQLLLFFLRVLEIHYVTEEERKKIVPRVGRLSEERTKGVCFLWGNKYAISHQENRYSH